jgi:hypothetical protein
MFLYHCPAGSTPELALDAALKRADDRGDTRHVGSDQERDLSKLRSALEYHLGQCLSDEALHGALDILDEYLPGGEHLGHGKRYGEGEGHYGHFPSEDESEEERHGEDEYEHLPRNAREGGMGGRTGEDRRRHHADDRRMATDSGNDWLAELTARIGTDTSFRYVK